MVDLTNEDMLEIEREYCRRSLANFVKRAWHVIEPGQPYIHGWHIDAIAEHLKAVTDKEITRLYIAVPPGSMKSLLVGCFFPAYEWGPAGLSNYRYLGTSHSQTLATRDNMRARRLITSEWYQALWPVTLTGDQNAKTKYENTATGFREAMAFTGLTGARGDRVLMDDVMSVDDALSDAKRNAIIQTFLEAVPTRLNNPDTSAIINIQQRLHVDDTIGVSIAKDLGYEGLVLPMEFDPTRRCVTSIGFKDPRKEEGELLFPERFPREVVDRDKRAMGSFATASQFQQLPVPREGGMFKRSWFEVIDCLPVDIHIQWVRGWDLAATEAKQGQNPAYTAGCKLGLGSNGVWYIAHMARGQLSPQGVERLLVNTASQDGPGVIIDLPQDPGQSGKSQVRYLVKSLAGYTVKFGPESGSKEQRATPVASQAEAGNIKVLRGDWNGPFFDEVDLFPGSKFKDQIDALSRAFSRLVQKPTNDTFAAPIILT